MGSDQKQHKLVPFHGTTSLCFDPCPPRLVFYHLLYYFIQGMMFGGISLLLYLIQDHVIARHKIGDCLLMEGKGAQAAESGSIPHTGLCSTICLLAKVPMDINVCDLEETVIKILHIVKGSVGHVVQKEEHRVQCMGLLFWGWFHDYIKYPVDFFVTAH